MVFNLLDLLLNSVRQYLLNIFVCMVMKDTGLQFHFLVLSLSDFGFQEMLTSKHESVFRKHIRRIDIDSFWNVWQNSAMKPLVLGFYLLGGSRLLYQFPYSLLICLGFLFLLDSALVGCMFSKHLSISSRLSSLFSNNCL